MGNGYLKQITFCRPLRQHNFFAVEDLRQPQQAMPEINVPFVRRDDEVLRDLIHACKN
jgi:hypothetical protein